MDGSIADFRGSDSDAGWFGRGEKWLGGRSAGRPIQTQRPSNRNPVVLAGHGIHLRIDHGALEIKNGFTHYPQQREEWRFFPGQTDRPSRIVVLDGAGSVTFDVLAWLSEQDIPLIQLDYRGMAVTAIGNTSLTGAHPELMRAQLGAAHDKKLTLAIATWLVREKLARTRSVLGDLAPRSQARDTALAQLRIDLARLAKPWPGDLAGLLGVEGKNAELYFKAWHGMPIQWIGRGKRPSPEGWCLVGHRRSRGNVSRSARHPVQAMLNYGYAVLESMARTEAVKAGLDPMVGFLHQRRIDRLTRPGLVLDLMEPMRPEVDRRVLELVRDEKFCSADFTLTRVGTCRLHPQLARRVVGIVAGLSDMSRTVQQLAERIGFEPPKPRVHRSNAWIASRQTTKIERYAPLAD
jgi:CRISP-associated protein Cas1